MTSAPSIHDTEPDPRLKDLMNGAELDAKKFPPLRWCVRGIIPEGFTLLVGGPKIGKSWLTLSVALKVASGGRVLGAIDCHRPKRVLLLALEDGHRRLQSRCRKLLEDGESIPANLDILIKTEPGQVEATIRAWLETLDVDERHEALVIVDTLGKNMRDAAPGESAYSRDYKVAGRLKAITDDYPGMSLVAVHHDRKAESADFVDAVSGTNGLAGAADSIIVLHRNRNEDKGVLKVTGRDVNEEEYAVRTDEGRWTLAGDDLKESAAAAREDRATRKATSGKGALSAAVATCVLSAGPAGVTPEQAAAAVSRALGVTVDSKKAGTYLGRLVGDGGEDIGHGIHRPERGLYKRVESVESVESPGDHAGDHADSTVSTLSTPPLDGADVVALFGGNTTQLDDEEESV